MRSPWCGPPNRIAVVGDMPKDATPQPVSRQISAILSAAEPRQRRPRGSRALRIAAGTRPPLVLTLGLSPDGLPARRWCL